MCVLCIVCVWTLLCLCMCRDFSRIVGRHSKTIVQKHETLNIVCIPHKMYFEILGHHRLTFGDLLGQ